MLQDINFFLEAFGQTNREESERTNEGEITQAILLMNSPFVLRQIKARPGSFWLHADEEGTTGRREDNALCSNAF